MISLYPSSESKILALRSRREQARTKAKNSVIICCSSHKSHTMIRKASILRKQMAALRLATRGSSIIAATSGAGVLLIGIAAATLKDENSSEEHLSDPTGKCTNRGISRTKVDNHHQVHMTGHQNRGLGTPSFAFNSDSTKRMCQCEASNKTTSASSSSYLAPLV